MTTIKYQCPNCNHVQRVDCYPPVPAKVSGPPEDCYPGEGRFIDHDCCDKCDQKFDEDNVFEHAQIAYEAAADLANED